MFKNLSTPNQLYHSEAQHPNAMNVAQMQKKKNAIQLSIARMSDSICLKPRCRLIHQWADVRAPQSMRIGT